MFWNFFHELGELFIEFFRKEESLLILFLLGFVGVAVIPFLSVLGILDTIADFFLALWWLWVFLMLLPIIHDLFLHWRQELFKRSLEFILLELRMPRIIEKSPQAMEQVLQALHALRNAPGNFQEKYIEGQITTPLSLEVVSFSGEIHFYVRCLKKHRNLVEAAFFSYYLDVEIEEVEDYVPTKLPQSLPELYARGLDLWGAEMILGKEAAFPIKTYPNFEHEAEEKQFDPISVLIEVLGKAQGGEFIGTQLVIAPSDADWAKEWGRLLEDLRKPATMEVASDNPENGKRQVSVTRSPGQVDVLEAVEENLSKPAFLTLIRFLYTAPVAQFNDGVVRSGLNAAFGQYSALDLNSFKTNSAAGTRVKAFPLSLVSSARRVEYRKQRLFWNYRMREVPPETFWGKVVSSYPLNMNFASKRFQMTTEGIATLFHPPTAVVLTTPHLRRVESKKAGPPAGLAIFGEEGEIEKYQ